MSTYIVVLVAAVVIAIVTAKPSPSTDTERITLPFESKEIVDKNMKSDMFGVELLGSQRALLANISIGTPPQKMTMQFVSDTSDFFVSNKDCLSCQPPLFDCKASKTCEVKQKNKKVDEWNEFIYVGDSVKDTVTLKGTKASDIAFFSVTKENSNLRRTLQYLGASGIFGFGCGKSKFEKIPTPIPSIAKSAGVKPVVTVDFCKNVFHFGKEPTQLTFAHQKALPPTPAGGWQFELESYLDFNGNGEEENAEDIYKKSTIVKEPADLDIAFRALVISTKQFKTFNATAWKCRADGTVDCDRIAKFPDIVFKLGNLKHHFTKDDYTFKSQGKCRFNFYVFSKASVGYIPNVAFSMDQTDKKAPKIGFAKCKK